MSKEFVGRHSIALVIKCILEKYKSKYNMPITFCNLTKLAKMNKLGNTFAIESGGKCKQSLLGEG